MIVFSSFFKVLKRRMSSLMIYLAVVMVIIFILSTFSSGGNEDFYNISQGIVIKDSDNSALSGRLKEYLASVNDVKTGDYTEEQIFDMMYYTMISNYLEIPEGFEKAFLEWNKEGGENPGKILKTVKSTKNDSARMGYSVEAEIDSYLNLVSGYMKGGYDMDEAHGLTMNSLTDKSAVKIIAKVQIKDDRMFTVFQMQPYGILTMLLSAVLPVILRFGSPLIRRRSSVSSLPLVKRNIMLALAMGIVTVFILIVLVALASIMSGEAFSERWWLLVLDLTVLSVTVIMIVIAISNFNLKPESSNALINVIALSFSFLGGIFVPMEVLGKSAKSIGQFLPTYWYSEALIRIKNGGGLGDILNCLLIQLLFGVMVMGVGLIVGKYLEKKN